MARKLGAQAFFRKPVDAAALLDSIDWVTRAEAPGKGD
jgi:FixJ family two-component response regulator